MEASRGEREVKGEMCKQGSVLIGVLWSLFFLSALAAALYASIAPQIGLVERLKDRPRLSCLAQAGVQRARAVLKEDETESYDALNDAWADNEEAFREIDLGDEGYFPECLFVVSPG